MQNEYYFKIRMKWSYRRKIFHIRGIFAPNRKVAEQKLKYHVENTIFPQDRIFDSYDYDILSCKAV